MAGFVSLTVLCLAPAAGAAERQRLKGPHVPAAVARLAPVGNLPPSQRLNLAIGLPLRNEAELDKLLQQLYDPASPNYRRYLTPEQFTERFGPTEKDYQALMAFAKANGLTVTASHPDRGVLDVAGAVADIEQTFHVTLRVYPHPTEARTFYAPDVEPSVDFAVPILHISGLDNYALPHPNLVRQPAGPSANATPNSGSGPTNSSTGQPSYWGNDFRAAYVPGTSLTGTGQSVGLLEFDGYYASDITSYESQTGLPNVPLTNVAVNGGVSKPGGSADEVSLDIEMAVSMAPGLSRIYVFEAPGSTTWDDILSVMVSATYTNIHQFSCSWGGGSPDATAEGYFKRMAIQGQSFFNASGDSDAFTGSIPFPSDSTNITEVGGTTLTTGTGAAYSSETAWNWGYDSSCSCYVGSSGGISTYYAIPSYQVGISTTANQGSPTMRNVPDVALTADNVWVIYGNGDTGAFGGTSCAAPLWAAFTALINQQAAAAGLGTVGFLNPALYTIGGSANYTSDFHDITTGNNFWPSSQSEFSAVAGYDLCTGWGTPNGTNMINALAGPPLALPPAITTQPANQTAVVGGSASFSVTATGAAPLGYQWVFNGTNLAGATASALLLTNVQVAQAGSYAVVVTNVLGSVTSAVATLTVLIPPAITTQPSNQTAVVGANASFSVTATGTAPLSYQWTFAGTNLAGATATTLLLTNVQLAQAGSYAVVVTNAAASITSAVASLTVLGAMVVSNSFTLLAQGCTNGAVNPGETVTVNFGLKNTGTASTTNLVATLLATGGIVSPSGPQTYGVLSDNGTPAALPFTFTASGTCGGTNTATLQLQDGAANLGTVTFSFPLGQLTVATVFSQNFDGVTAPALPAGWASSASNAQSAWVTSTAVYDTAPNSVFSPDPASVGVNELDSPAITLPAGSAQLSFRNNYSLQTGRDGGVLEIKIGSGSWTDIVTAGGSFVSGGYNSTLSTSRSNPLGGRSAWSGNSSGGFITTLINLPSSASGESIQLRWRCGSDNRTSGTGWYVDTVSITSSNYVCCTASAPAAITVPPNSQTAIAGTNVTFQVTATGSPPLTYQWRFNGANLAGATTNTLTLTDVQASQAGSYAVVITNAVGSVTSAVATLTVLMPPAITLQPSNQTVIAGTSASFAVTATGTTPLAYQWAFDGTPLAGATASTLLLTSVQASQAGSYAVVVTNVAGSVTSALASLTVLLPPAISLQPSNQTVVAGTSASFTVTATGTTPLAYQWAFDGTTLAGATAGTLLLTNVQASQAGSYAVVVTNVAGSVTSAVASLTMLPPVTIRSIGLAGSGVSITFPSVTGLSYALEYKPSLNDSTWTTLSPPVAGTGGIMVLQDTNAPVASRFYRVLRE